MESENQQLELNDGHLGGAEHPKVPNVQFCGTQFSLHFGGSAGTFISKVNEMGLRSKEDDGAYHCALLLSLLMTHPSRNL